MRTERTPDPCPECGGGPVWAVTSSDGQRVTLDCTACPWYRVTRAG